MVQAISKAILLTIFVFNIPITSADTVATDTQVWPTLKNAYFGDRVIHQASPELLKLEAPKRAEDAAIVPIRMVSEHAPTPDNYIRNLHVFIDNNPMPYSANFQLSPKLGQIDIGTRVRVDRYTPIRAIAEMNDGSLHMVSDFIKATGGCSAPAGKDRAAAMARLGKMQLRMRSNEPGKPVPVQLIISHPNNSGLQMDQVTRGYIPPHYVETIAIRFNDAPLIKLESSISLSEDPSIRFMFTPEQAGVLQASVTDSKGAHFETEKNL